MNPRISNFCTTSITLVHSRFGRSSTWVGSLHVWMQMPAHLVSSRYLHFCTSTCIGTTTRLKLRLKRNQLLLLKCIHTAKAGLWHETDPAGNFWAVWKLHFIDSAFAHQPLACGKRDLRCARHPYGISFRLTRISSACEKLSRINSACPVAKAYLMSCSLLPNQAMVWWIGNHHRARQQVCHHQAGRRAV